MIPTAWQWTRTVALATSMALGTQAEAQEKKGWQPDRAEWARDLKTPGTMIPVRVMGDTAMIDDMVLGSWSQIDTYGLADWQPARLKSPAEIKGGNRPARLWHGIDVPFDFDVSYNEAGRAIVKQAIALYQLQTGIRFTPRTGQTDYILFTRRDGECTSNLGKVGKAQAISMNNACMVSLTDTLHFMGHALGLGHTHQRAQGSYNNVPGFPILGSMSSPQLLDWQKYSTTLARQIESGHPSSLYDLASVMHYDPHRRDGLDLEPKPGTPHIHARQLSESDIRELAKLYPAAARDARQQSAPRKWQTGKLKVPGTDQCLGYTLANIDNEYRQLQPPHLVSCSNPTARWTWDNHQRLQSGYEFNRCIDLEDTHPQTPRVRICSYSSTQPWQYKDHKLVRNGLTLMRDANDKIVAHDLSKASSQRLKAGHSQLWEWVPDSQP